MTGDDALTARRPLRARRRCWAAEAWPTCASARTSGSGAPWPSSSCGPTCPPTTRSRPGSAARRSPRRRSTTRRSSRSTTPATRTPDGNHIPYIVMEYVEGQTLREILREGRKILPERALEITADVRRALDYRHRSGIIHRDIKPANVMLTPAGQVKVMDFGIARAIADSSSAMTATAAVVGTAQYLSPEQARGETGRRPQRHLLHRLPAVTSCSPAARRSWATARSRWRTSTCARRPGRRPAEPEVAARDRRHRRQGARQEAPTTATRRRRDAGRHRAGAGRAGRRRHRDHGRCRVAAASLPRATPTRSSPSRRTKRSRRASAGPGSGSC